MSILNCISSDGLRRALQRNFRSSSSVFWRVSFALSLVVSFSPTQDAAANVDANLINPGIVSVNGLTPTGNFGVAETISFTWRNFGTQSISPFQVNFRFSVDGVDQPVESLSGSTLAPGQSGTLTFSRKADLSGIGSHEITVSVFVASDSDPSNNVASLTVETLNPYPTDVISTLPYVEDFEAGPGGWQSFTPTGGMFANPWALGTPTKDIIVGANSGVNAWATNLTGPYSPNSRAQVVSPVLDLTNVPFVEVNLAVFWESPRNGTGAAIQVSNDNGESWDTIGTNGDPNNWYPTPKITGLGYLAGPTDLQGQQGTPGWSGYNTAGTTNGQFGSPYDFAGSAFDRTRGSAYLQGSGTWRPAKNVFQGGSSTTRLRVAFGSPNDFVSGVLSDDGFAFDDIVIKSAANAKLTASLFTDLDSDGFADPGDVIRFTSVVSNTSSFSQVSSTIYTDLLADTNLALVVGSVTTSAGSVVTGNTMGNTTVAVNVGTLAAGGSATVTYDATVGAIAASTPTVCSQGVVTASQFGTNQLLTDNPVPSGVADQTCVSSLVDADGDGVKDNLDICPGSDDSDDADNDGTPDGCDTCVNDPNKSAPGICGCGTPDADVNGNGIIDCIDPVANASTTTGFCAPGQTDCYFQPLRPSTCVGANGFLGHVNIASVVNLQNTPLATTVQYFDSFGVKRGEVQTTIAAQLKQDFIVNDLGLQPDTVGNVCVVTNGGFGSWTGANVVYKPAANSSFGEDFDYALYFPFQNEYRAPVGVPVNTFRLGTDPTATIGNWISIGDALRDGLPLTGRIFYYDSEGLVKKVEGVFIADGGRGDFAAHEGVTAGTNVQTVGSALFIPDNLPGGNPAQFYLTATRYFYDCPGSSCTNFLTAFNASNRPGTKNFTVNGVSTIDGELSVVELNNFGTTTANVEVDIYDEAGTILSTTTAAINQKATKHVIIAGPLVDSGKVASAEVRVLQGFISAAVVHYSLDGNGVMQQAYSSPFVGSPGMNQFSQYNSFISHSNISEITNSSPNTSLVQLQYFNSVGAEVLNEMFLLEGHATRRQTPSLPNDDYGTIVMSADRDGVVFKNFIARPGQYTLPVIGR